jgi:hypothetical protein
MLVGVFGVGVVAGAVLGESQRPSSGSGSFSGQAAAAWVAGVLATTAAAGTAHLRYDSATKSPDPAYRVTQHGSGVVDFSSRDFQVTEVSHEIQTEAFDGEPAREMPETWTEESIGIGKLLYWNLSSPISNWTKFPDRDPHRALGLDQVPGADYVMGGLDDTIPVVSVQALGPATVQGVSTTRYRVTNETFHYCLPQSKKLSLTLVWPTTLWVDGEGRIVQVATSQQLSSGLVAKVNALSGRPAPPPFPSSTTATVLRFSNFGEPVHITAPVLSPNPPKGFTIGLNETPPVKGRCRS